MTDDSLLKQQLDEYHLVALLKGGGMARVYLGFDERLRRYSAVKIMHQPLRADPNYIRRFEQEARTIGQLEHPNIVRLYRYGNVNGLLYMAMQYIEGTDLRTLLESYQRQGEWIVPADIVSIVRQIGLALDYAHQRGVVHRDVKPSNILLGKDGQVFLADFGISLFTDFETRGEVFGTPHYMAPEQAISSDRAVAQSDLYAVGVMLYEMFTGKLPFDAPAPLNIAQQHINQPPPPPRTLRPELDPAVEAVILKALAKEPSTRYATGAELADALAAALSLESNPAPTLVLSPALLGRIAQLSHALPTPSIAPVAYLGPAATTQTLTQRAVSPPRRTRRFSRAAWGLGLAALLLLLGFLAAFARLGGLGYAGGATGQGTRVAQSGASGIITATTPTLAPTLAFTPTATLSPTATSTVTPTATLSATSTPTTVAAAISPIPTVTATVQPTPTAVLSETPTVTPTLPQTPKLAQMPRTPGDYTLRLVKAHDQSLVVINTTPSDFPLNKLNLRSRTSELNGAEWGVTLLQPNACVIVQQAEGKAATQDLGCTITGESLVRQGSERFWGTAFDVYYNGQWVGACPQNQSECRVTTTPKTRDNVINPEKPQDNGKKDNGKKNGKKKGNGKGND